VATAGNIRRPGYTPTRSNTNPLSNVSSQVVHQPQVRVPVVHAAINLPLVLLAASRVPSEVVIKRPSPENHLTGRVKTRSNTGTLVQTNIVGGVPPAAHHLPLQRPRLVSSIGGVATLCGATPVSADAAPDPCLARRTARCWVDISKCPTTSRLSPLALLLVGISTFVRRFCPPGCHQPKHLPQRERP